MTLILMSLLTLIDANVNPKLGPNPNVNPYIDPTFFIDPFESQLTTH